MKLLKQFVCWGGGMAMLLFPALTKASDIDELTPLTDKIIMVHFNDGYVEHHENGKTFTRSSGRFVRDELDVTEAVKTSNYQIKSTDDAAYATAKTPVTVGRKSKGMDFLSNATSSDKAASHHWIYLHLDEKLVSGKTYTVTTGTLAKNSNAFTFVYDEKKMRSEAVKVNQIGYLPDASMKYGYVYHWMGDKGPLALDEYAGKNFWIVDAESNNVVYTGSLVFRKPYNNMETHSGADTPYQNFLGADVYECDFSSFTTPGRYRLAVEGIGCSFPFTISDDIYAAPFKSTIRSLFHNHSGTELPAEFTEFYRPAPHNPYLTPGFKGRLKYTTVRACDFPSENYDKAVIEAGYKGTIDVWGWYQDAGDWDGYTSHGCIPAFLLLAYELAPEKYTDGQLDIPQSYTTRGTVNPEKTNGIPDILDEARWLIMYYYRTRHAIMDNGWGTGGVGGGRTYGDLWGGDGAGSWTDTNRDWYVTGEDPFQSYWYAGLAAHYAYLLKISGKKCPTLIDWKQEAIDSYEWAKNNTKPGDETKSGLGTLRQMRMYAAVNLYKLTGAAAYHTQFKSDAKSINASSVFDGTSGVNDRCAVYSYLLTPSAPLAPDAELTATLKQALSNTAKSNIIDPAKQRGCRWGVSLYMPMLTGQSTTPWIFDAMADAKINGNRESYAYGLTTLDYFLGNNPMNSIQLTPEKEDGKRKDRRYISGLFHLDSWYNVRKDTFELPGYALYGAWTQANNVQGAGSWLNEWAYSTAYPAIQNEPTNPRIAAPDAWPGHELIFFNRYAPLANEFTVHQNCVHWAVATGFYQKDITANPFNYMRLALPDAEPTDAEKLAAASAALDIIYAEGDNASSVTADAVFPVTGEYGASVSWSTNNAALISNSGVVSRPESRANVKVTATLTIGNSSVNKEYTLTILGVYETDAQPSVPTKLTGTYTATGIRLSWTAPTSNVAIKHYLIYRSEPGQKQPDILVGETGELYYDVEGLEEGLTYRFGVKAVGMSDKVSSFSNLYSATIVFDAIDMAAMQSINIYPNPVKSGETVAIELPDGYQNGMLMLTDIRGVTVWQQTMHNASVRFTVGQPAGVYILQIVIDGNKKEIRRIQVY